MNRTLPRERGRASLPVLLAILTSALFASSVALGTEPPPGSIAGTVTLPDGTGVSGASVTIHSLETGADRVVVTGPKGEYVSPPLAGGTYRVSVHARGLATPESRDVTVRADRSTTATFTLGGQEAKASVVVTAPEGQRPFVDRPRGRRVEPGRPAPLHQRHGGSPAGRAGRESLRRRRRLEPPGDSWPGG